ncbi:MAG: P1 family peptidase [Lachnospiraceae bacterium]|nr:P1 family peptidase [Lachnospiraceae bacterium]
MVKEISITEIEGVRIGNAQNADAKTGVTVLLFDQGAKVGVDISGGGPASRETPLASPLTADNPVHAIVLSGGSAFGLAAGDGVMRYLEERGVGYETGYAKVPLVCQSCIYDLGCGRADIRPDADMGYAACADAEKNQPLTGSVGGGAGATVGKLCGMERSMKAGLGIHAVAAGDLQMAAVVVVNALGDIYDPENGRKIAGLRTEDGQGFADTCQMLCQIRRRQDLLNSNTTIGAVVTNGRFSKAEMSKIASMARSAYGRCIRPVGTMADGDTIYAASAGNVEADINVAGTLAAEVMAQAIKKAVQ